MVVNAAPAVGVAVVMLDAIVADFFGVLVCWLSLYQRDDEHYDFGWPLELYLLNCSYERLARAISLDAAAVADAV